MIFVQIVFLLLKKYNIPMPHNKVSEYFFIFVSIKNIPTIMIVSVLVIISISVSVFFCIK